MPSHICRGLRVWHLVEWELTWNYVGREGLDVLQSRRIWFAVPRARLASDQDELKRYW